MGIMFPAKGRLMRCAVIAGVIFVLVAGLIAAANSRTRTVVVTVGQDGFSPAKITVHKGDTVRFVNDAQDDIWPASDSHPTHQRYPEFDPGKPLPPGSSWTVTFARAGVWPYHDHASPDVHGIIVVVGEPGETARECLSRDSQGPAAVVCWEGDIAYALEKGGLDGAFDTFASLYANDPLFRGLSCHDITHTIGAAAYKAYSADHATIDRPETSYCGYGFYHGFMEAMLLEQGPGNYKKVITYCEALKTDGTLNNVSGACYHGIGHAAFDSIPGQIWGSDTDMVQSALSVCENALSDEAERVQCSTGVFNSLANAKSARAYRLSFGKTDPMRICRNQPPLYQRGCYAEMGIGVIREEGFDRMSSLRFIEKFPNPDGVFSALLAYVADEVGRTIAAFDSSAFHRLCTSFASQKDNEACMRGVVVGLRQWGEPGKEYVPMLSYCARYPSGNERTACCVFATSQVPNLTPDTAESMKSCTTN